MDQTTPVPEYLRDALARTAAHYAHSLECLHCARRCWRDAKSNGHAHSGDGYGLCTHCGGADAPTPHPISPRRGAP